MRQLLALLLLAGCNYPGPAIRLPTPATAISPIPTLCQYRTAANGQTLPDPVCTPGATNPDVTQANIGMTICKSGWTATVRPPTSFTTPLKLRSMREYGVTTSVSTVEYDHDIPLELGGAPRDTLNLWPQPGLHNDKDTVENKLNKLVCQGKLSLIDAQQRIVSDWTTAVP